MKQLIQFIKKILINGGAFVIIGYLCYETIFSEVNFEKIGSTLLGADIRFIALGVLSIIFAISLEAFIMKRNLALLEEKSKYKHCITYALCGNFFSAITPAATGGQPAVLYFMNKNSIPMEKGILALLMDLGAYQTAIVGLAVIGYLSNSHIINQSLDSFKVLLWVGLTLNIVLLSITVIAIFSKSITSKILALCIKLLSKISPNKALSLNEKATESINKYNICSQILKKNKKDYIINIILTYIRIITIYSVPFWIYKSFGLTSASFFTIFSLQATLYISCAALPFPGTVGVGESGFLQFFKVVFPKDKIYSAMLLSRSITVYLMVLFCGVSLFVITLLANMKRRYHGKSKQCYR